MKERHAQEVENCTFCPKLCRHVCPVGNATGSETLTPQLKMELLNMLNRSALPWEADFVAPLYGCTSCKLCKQSCLHDVDVSEALLEGRRLAEARRLAPAPLQKLQERFRDRSKRLMEKLHKEFSAQMFAEEAQVGFFPGCDTIDHSIGDIRDAMTVFESLDLNFVRLMESPFACAGYPLWAGGCLDAARFVATDMVKSLRRFATVVVGCPACAWLLKEKLPAEGFEHNTEVLHLTEFLYVHAERLNIHQTREAAFYHDPCYLGRYLGIYEPPRRLLSRCVQSTREFFSSQEEAECCGGGGLVPHTFPEAALLQAKKRLDEAELYDVPLVVTSCPTCKRTLSAADSRVEVLELINLLAWSIREPEHPALEHGSDD